MLAKELSKKVPFSFHLWFHFVFYSNVVFCVALIVVCLQCQYTATSFQASSFLGTYLLCVLCIACLFACLVCVFSEVSFFVCHCA